MWIYIGSFFLFENIIIDIFNYTGIYIIFYIFFKMKLVHLFLHVTSQTITYVQNSWLDIHNIIFYQF